jgi:hypothetical protein
MNKAFSPNSETPDRFPPIVLNSLAEIFTLRFK